MTTLDERFLKMHERTALWHQQREKCRACANLETEEMARVMRCKLVPIATEDQRASNMFAGRGLTAYCIDAREPGAACGPDAKLFTPAVVGAAADPEENSDSEARKEI